MESSLQILNALPIVGLCVACLVWWRRRPVLNRQVRDRIARVDAQASSAVREGCWARVTGRVVSDETLVAPLSGRRCVAYVVHVSQIERRPHRHWALLGSEVQGLRFELHDAAGKILVDPQRGELSVPTKDVGFSGFLDAPRDAEREVLVRVGALAEGQDLPSDAVYREGILVAGDTVDVLGWCIADGLEPHSHGGLRDQATPRRVLVASVSDPILIARAD